MTFIDDVLKKMNGFKKPISTILMNELLINDKQEEQLLPVCHWFLMITEEKLFLFLMTVFSKSFLTHVRSHLMSFPFFTAWHGV